MLSTAADGHGGRCLCAQNPLPFGAVVLRERPLAAAPVMLDTDSTHCPHCLRLRRPVRAMSGKAGEMGGRLCGACELHEMAFCSAECEQAHMQWHTRECGLLEPALLALCALDESVLGLPLLLLVLRLALRGVPVRRAMPGLHARDGARDVNGATVGLGLGLGLGLDPANPNLVLIKHVFFYLFLFALWPWLGPIL